jgi:hypothetical protein
MPSAGASGALFGLVGVLFVFGIKFRRELPEGFKRTFGTGLLPMILINLFIGYLGRGLIDNAAHLGGFLSGCALALVVGYKRPGERAGVAVFWHILQSAALVLVALSFFMAYRHFPKQLPPPGENAAAPRLPFAGGEASSFAKNNEAFIAGQKALLNTLKSGTDGGVDSAIKILDQSPHLSDETDGVRDELKSLLLRAKDNVAQRSRPQQAPTRSQVISQQKLLADIQAWQTRYNKWFKEEGKKYGIEVKGPPGSKS